jgi:hypothetical protein
VKKSQALMMIFVLCLFCLVEPGMAADNPLEIDVNASGDDYGSSIMYMQGSNGLEELEVDWNEKVYYDAEPYEYFHPAITIENTGKNDGFLIVKIDILQYETFLSAETYYFAYTGDKFKTPLLKAASQLNVNNPEDLTFTFLRADQKITVLDYLDQATYEINGPVIMTAMLYENTASPGTLPISWDNVEMLGIDVQTIFINTDFSTWMQ